MNHRPSRREILFGVPAALLPSDMRRFADPATEFEVVRLTDPAFASRMLPYWTRSISKRSTFLIYSSDRAGSWQLYRMDLKSGESRQITDAAALVPDTAAMTPDERSVLFFDGPKLVHTTVNGERRREIYTATSAVSAAAATADSMNAVFIDDGKLMLVSTAKGNAQTIADVGKDAIAPRPSPRRAQIFYQKNDEIWIVNLDGRQNRRLKTAEGKLGPAMWQPDGQSVIYLNFPEQAGVLNNIRESIPDENTDRRLAPTSQFAHFGQNSDASVFVGASRNRGAPHLLLMLRQTRRELTMCEHKASDPAMVAPVFSPDSQRIFFVSDKHGKPCIYRVDVQRFVEKTDEA